MPNKVEQLSIKDQLSQALEEVRIVMPGIQALFGFQLVAVFNSVFFTRLTQAQQELHLLATGLSAVAAAFALAPAALHRISEPDCASSSLVKRAGVLLLLALFPLSVGISIDMYILTSVITKSEGLAEGTAVLTFLGFALLWFALPYLARRKNIASSRHPLEDDEEPRAPSSRSAASSSR